MAKKAQKSREEQIRDLLVGEAVEFVQERTKFLAERITPESKIDYSERAKKITELAQNVGGCQSNALLDLVEAIIGEPLPRPAGNKGGNFFVHGAVFAFAKKHPSVEFDKDVPLIMLPDPHRGYGSGTDLYRDGGLAVSLGTTPRSKVYYRAGTEKEVEEFVSTQPTHILVRILEVKSARERALSGEEEE